MSQLKHLNLTERDFELIVEGLSALPDKGAAGELMGDLFRGILAKDDKEAQDKILAEREIAQNKRKKEKQLLLEDIQILQGKILMLKRYLIEQGALNETYEIINHIS